MDDDDTLGQACALNAEILMFEHDFRLRQASRRRQKRRLWLQALHEGATWQEIQDRCGVAKYTLTKQLSLARRENPDLAERLPRNRPRPGIEYPCGHPGCDAILTSGQALGGHRNLHRKTA